MVRLSMAQWPSQGDQYYINVLLVNEGLVGEDSVLDNVSLNTPPQLFCHDTMLVSLQQPQRAGPLGLHGRCGLDVETTKLNVSATRPRRTRAWPNAG